MYGSSVTSLPAAGVGSTAAMAAMRGQAILALVLASLCMLMLGIMMLRGEAPLPEDEI